ncbi:MAG: IPT/TIG domain-containing protein, partial [Flammeovirgaceae bacterium]
MKITKMNALPIALAIVVFATSCQTENSQTPAVKISTVSPVVSKSGSDVQISGEGFSPSINNNEVKFNGVSAQVKSASATLLKVTVPNGEVSGKVTV